MFLRNCNVNKALFLVDRIELEEQAYESFNSCLKNDYKTVICPVKTDYHWFVVTRQHVLDVNEITGNDVYKPSEMLLKLAESGERLGEAHSKEDRKEKLDFQMSTVANNF